MTRENQKARTINKMSLRSCDAIIEILTKRTGRRSPQIELAEEIEDGEEGVEGLAEADPVLLGLLVELSLQHQSLLVGRVVQQDDDPALLRKLLALLARVHQVEPVKEQAVRFPGIDAAI